MSTRGFKNANLAKILLYGCMAAVVVAVGMWGVSQVRTSTPLSADSLMLLETPLSSSEAEHESPVERRTTTTAEIWVQVTGEVRMPGVYRLPRGSRVFEAIEAAGGSTPAADTDALNLAAPVGDGSRIVVPRLGEPGAGTAAGTGSGAGPQTPPGGVAAPISLSTADAATLDSLPGVGPTTAAAIIAYREEHGPFQSVDELEKVPGIGPATLAKIRDLVVP